MSDRMKIRRGDVINFFEYEKVRERPRRRGDRAEAPAPGGGGARISRSSSRTARPCCSRSRRCAAPSASSTTPRSRRRSTSTTRCCRGRASCPRRCSSRSPTRTQIKPVLDRFMGIDTAATSGSRSGEDAVPGAFEAGHSDEEKGKLAAVHFVPLRVLAGGRARVPRTSEVDLVVDHPGDRGRTVLTPAVRRRLAEDFS